MCDETYSAAAMVPGKVVSDRLLPPIPIATLVFVSTVVDALAAFIVPVNVNPVFAPANVLQPVVAWPASTGANDKPKRHSAIPALVVSIKSPS
jgi:hypothetical protein